MLELFAVGLVLVAFLFLWLAMRLKDTWSYLQIMFLVVSFSFIIMAGAFIGVVATNADTAKMAWGFMNINIIMLIVIVMFFMLYFIKEILENLSEVKT